MPSIRVLLVQYHSTGAPLAADFVSDHQLQTERSYGLADALQRLVSKPFDVVLLEFESPDSHDLVALRTLRAAKPNIPIMALTTTNDDSWALAALREGAHDCLVKCEVKPDRLKRALRYAVERSGSEKRLRQETEQSPTRTPNIHQVLWVIDAKEAKTLYVSSGYEQLWGCSCPIRCNNPPTYLEGIHDLDQAIVTREFTAMFQTGSIDLEARVVRPDGSMRWIWIRSKPVFEDDQIARVVVIIEDITDKKRLAMERDAVRQFGGHAATDPGPFLKLLGAIQSLP